MQGVDMPPRDRLKKHFQLGAVFSVSVLLSGCYPAPSIPKSDHLTMSSYIHSQCDRGGVLVAGHHSACLKPIQGTVFLLKREGLPERAALADLKDRKTIRTARPLTPYFVAHVAPGRGKDGNAGSPAIDAGAITSGAGIPVAGTVLDAAGLLLDLAGGASAAPPKWHYQDWVPSPFLNFYRFLPTTRLQRGVSMTGLEPLLTQGYQLILSARNGTPMSAGSLDFMSTHYSGQSNTPAASTVFAMPWQDQSVSRSKLVMVWDGQNNGIDGYYKHHNVIEFAEVNYLDRGRDTKAAIMIAVRTGQPSGFYTIARVRKIEQSLPFSKRWYGVFDIKSGGGLDVVVLHNGLIKYLTKN
jgi:hypothetical protein